MVSWLLTILKTYCYGVCWEYKNIFDDDLMEKNIVSWSVLTSCYYKEGGLKTEFCGMTVLGTYARMTVSLATILKITKG